MKACVLYSLLFVFAYMHAKADDLIASYGTGETPPTTKVATSDELRNLLQYHFADIEWQGNKLAKDRRDKIRKPEDLM